MSRADKTTRRSRSPALQVLTVWAGALACCGGIAVDPSDLADTTPDRSTADAGTGHDLPQELIEEHARVWCEYDLRCGMRHGSFEECYEDRLRGPALLRCVHSEREIRECVQRMKTQACLVISATSCYPVAKSPDGC